MLNLEKLMSYLFKIGIKTLMLEGGSTLNYSMLTNGLVSELRICVAPMIAGGKYAKTLADGDGVDNMEDSVKLEFKNSYKLGNDLIVEYKVNPKN